MVLVTNGRLITRDSEGKGYYEHGAVAYEGAKIVEVGEEAALRAKYADAEIVDAKGGVIMPAFINAHTHIYSALARGLSIVGQIAMSIELLLGAIMMTLFTSTLFRKYTK